MPPPLGRNVEIKARPRDVARTRDAARSLADSAPTLIRQVDTFFRTQVGRLKLRVFEDGSGELIHYERADTSGPKESRYVIARLPQAEDVRSVLAGALGVRTVVRKTRMLYLVGQTRIHIDEVEGLGTFLELEVVLRADQSAEDGHRVAEELMVRLGVATGDLVAGAYADLLADRG
jgi:predicted adenylyl cyclase CyaB